ncbi:hypothetical protein DFQ01_14427 [Paenibacillus cellulosilyticus]|uniref:Uncharacterized protein n=1 Tax=Paenibacillus cellulosilyticus TaxID=375489 RepID=A0A2V2YDX9_9BACL|nr:hypothetical protein [Paenibacillus cellulosilyticus]PWV90251.1 hypothetical protein DFQ01_14427 [Paenibacillus cellulosilyticus]QKS43409.1 hypothetical protein HUB94_02490 [Paenibacillus cellulosilyticus]
MSDFLLIAVTGFVFLCGFVLGRNWEKATQPLPQPSDKEQTVLVRRVKSSFRNPARTFEHDYNEYKTRGGLYAPVKPGKGSTADDIDVGRKE